MSKRLIGDPSFVNCFKDRRKAIQAINFLVLAKENNHTYKQILENPLFRSSFKEEYLNFISSDQLEWRLKNIARDLKVMSFNVLHSDWHDFKRFFEGTRRKNKINVD